jgi:hypothetical protein
VTVDPILLAVPAGFAAGAGIGLAGFDVLRRRALLARRVVAGIAGMAAIATPAAATGLAAWDAVLRAGLATGFVLLAGRSRPVWWIPGAVVTTVAMAGAGPRLAVAMTVLGATVALSASARRLPLAGAVVGALLVLLALRLEWPHQTGATAALAGLALLPTAVSGLRQSPRAARRVAVRLGLAAAVLVVVGALTGLAGGLFARNGLTEGAAALEAGVAAVRRGDEAATATALSDAARRFAEARDALDATWLLPSRLVPVVAQHVTAGQQAARAGSELAFTGAETVSAANLQSLEVADGGVDLDRVRSLRAPVARARAGLDAAHRALVAASSSRWLLPPLVERLDREIARIDGSRRQAAMALAMAEQLPPLLGGDGARRYFLAIQSPAELRGSGGIIGSFGEVAAEGGRLAVGSFGRDGDLNTKGTPPAQRTLPGPADYRARYGRFEPQRIWQNVSVSPHFPAVAEVIAGLYPQSGGSEIDGVISVDPTGLAAFLGLVGPVDVAPWPEPLTAGNAERILLHEQYVRLEGTARTDFLGDVAEAVGARLTSGALPPPVAIVEALAPAVRGNHIALWSPVAAEQALFRLIGADGGLPPVRTDSLAVVNVNSGGNKVDWFLRRSSDYVADVDASKGKVTGTLTVTLRNEAPSSGLPSYVIGTSLTTPVDPVGANRTYLSVYSPLALAGATLDGEAVTVESAREVGRNVYSLYLVVPPGGTRTLTFTLSGRVPGDGAYGLHWRAQPLPAPEVVSARVTSGGRTLVVRPAAALTGDETLPSA